MKPILELINVNIHFPLSPKLFKKRQFVYAVNNINLKVYEGETLGIVGESGCGKTSLARALVHLNHITSGSIIFNDEVELATASNKEWTPIYKEIQFIFQDPFGALNPRMTVAEIIAEPLINLYPNLTKEQVTNQVIETISLVGLSPQQLNRYPQEFSGGQCQRIGIARALIVKPKILICDESVSALDVSIKAQIINLLKSLKQQLNLTIIFISHDISIVNYMCDRILVMYLGEIMELGNKIQVCHSPYHPYTQALLSAVPIADPKLEQQKSIKLLEGDIPSPLAPPIGCSFSTRCPLADEACKLTKPNLRKHNDSYVACLKV